MSYNSKKTIASLIAGVMLVAAYAVYALGEHSPAPDNLKSWAIAMLAFIGIGVAVVIVVQIVFHIALAIGIAAKEQGRDDKEVERIISSSMVEDEREKLINLKSAHVGNVCAGIGFIAALAALALGMSAVVALHVLLGAFAVGSVIEGFVGVYFYEKGVRNG
jgi:hypothetical protein